MNEKLGLVSQKLITPKLHEKIIFRPRLIQCLTESEARIVSITASAGFGKTVLLTQLADALKQPIVWYHLDVYDNDPAVFWRYLIAGCQMYHPNFGKEALCFLKNNQANAYRSRTILSMLMNDLSLFVQGMTLVIDDLHILSESEVKSFIEDLLFHLPEGVKVMLAAREDIFQLNRLRVDGNVLCFDHEDLCFTRSEISTLYAKNKIELSEEALDVMEKSTGGWPLAVSLAANSPAEINTGFSKKDKDLLFNYMASEILVGEEEEVRRFLIAIAVLEEITPEYCNLLLERNDSRKLLTTLRKKYFFLIPFSDQKNTYRYHQLFRDYLLEQLEDERFIIRERK